MDWTPEMKAAAMADAQKVCDLTAEVSRLTQENEGLRTALKPFARYAEMRSAQPLSGLGDIIHCIHTGSPFEAEIRLSDCEAARAVSLSEEGMK